MESDQSKKFLIIGVYPSGNKYVLSCQGEGTSYEECVESLSLENRLMDAQLADENKGIAFIIETADDWGDAWDPSSPHNNVNYQRGLDLKPDIVKRPP